MQDLNTIYDFCKNNYTTSFANTTLSRIKYSIENLKIFPQAYPIYFYSNNYIFRKKVVKNRFLIIFSIINNYVFIRYVFDGRQNINISNLFK